MSDPAPIHDHRCPWLVADDDSDVECTCGDRAAVQRYEWAVHNMSGLFQYNEDEDAARGHAEASGSELLRRPIAEWESVATLDEDEA